eukprot:TRINITY_DN905_c2_g1_i1.p1 TRINITY_DN905_c2_g1~~TRINITY_DN905_c2_g1_i1.p1  ORF type:complete len:475 (+),score=93.30 TRINITY_DN905_c2_g1_i1:39-1463(+)
MAELPSDIVLPEERHRSILGLLSVTGGMEDGKRDLLQRLIQSSETEQGLKAQMEEENISSVVATMIDRVKSTTDLDSVRSLLELMSMMIKVNDKFATCFTKCAAATEQTDPGLYIEKWTRSDHSWVSARSMEILAHFISQPGCEDYGKKCLPTFLKTIQTQLNQALRASEQTAGDFVQSAEACVKALSIMTTPSSLRADIVETGVTNLLPRLLFPSENVFAACCEERAQFIYDATKTLWLLTFIPESLIAFDASCKPADDAPGQSIIMVLNSLLKRQKKEKAIRMTLLVLMNYANCQKSQKGNAPNYLKEMIGVGMIQNLEMLQKRNFGDADILPDIRELLELLETNVEDLSSYSQYKQELHSGILEWSPPHTSDKFWKENAKAFEADDYASILELCHIIETSKRSVNIQIACHDIGEFVRHHPQGRRQWDRLCKDRLKQKLYDLMDSAVPEEKRQALLCMQKVMCQRWDFLQS